MMTRETKIESDHVAVSISDKTRTVLISTLGAEPQVVTLMLDELLARRISIDRTVVLHTLDTVSPIREALNGLQHEFIGYPGYRKVLFIPHALSGVSGALIDVTSADDVETAFQSIYTLIRQMKHAGWRIHLSIAGGRKTLGFTALSVAQILFDSTDSIWHLVSDPALLASRSFHATMPHQVTLVPIPVRAWAHRPREDSSRVQAFLQQALTPAEREVTCLLVREGLSNQALAERLGKSVRTVENQLSNVYAKAEHELGLETRVDRVVLLSVIGGNPYVE